MEKCSQSVPFGKADSTEELKLPGIAEKAEKFTKEGDKIFKELQLEYCEKYMPPLGGDEDLHETKPKGQYNVHVKKDLQYGFEKNNQDEM